MTPTWRTALPSAADASSTLQRFSSADIRALRGGLSRPRFGALLGVSANTVYRWELPPESPHHLNPSPAARRQLARVFAEGGSGQPVTGPASPTATTAERPHFWRGSVMEQGALAEAYNHVVDSRYAEARQVLVAMDLSALSHDLRAEAAALEARCALLGRGDAQSALKALAPWSAPADRAGLSPHASALVFLWLGFALGWPHGRHFDRERALALLHGAMAEMARLDERGAVFWAELGIGLVHYACTEVAEARRHLSQVLLTDSQDARTAWRTWRQEAAGIVARLDHGLRRAIIEYEQVLLLAATRDDRYARARALALLTERHMETGDPPHLVLSLGRQAQALFEELGSPLDHTTVPLVRGLGETYLGLGQFDALRALVEPTLQRLEACGGSPYLMRELLARLHLREGDTPGARRQLQACRSLTGPVDRIWGLTLAAQLEASILLTEGAANEAVAAWERAREATELLGSVPMHGECEAGRCEALVQAGRTVEAREALENAERELASVPSPWLQAVLARVRARLLHAEGRLAEARAQMALAVNGFTHATDPWEAQKCAEFLARWPQPEEPKGAAIPASALERLCGLSQGGPERVLGELCAALRELQPGAAVGVFSMAGECVAGDGALVDSIAHEAGSFGGGTGPRYRLLMAGVVPAAFVRPLLAVADLALDAARMRQGVVVEATAETELTDEGLMVGSASMRQVMNSVRRLGSLRATVLLQGESGVGKELVARAIHKVSGRSGLLVSFNCAAVPLALFESQLFGHVRGAFTGAERDALGFVRGAHGGTLLLDEVGELPLEVQPKLLRFLEEGEVLPVGSIRPERVDVRVVAATHRDLKALVRDGRFREDLFYRLNVVPLRVPPLRERPEEIPMLAEHFLRRLCGVQAPRLSVEALAALTSHAWPGNARQLRNELERIVALHGPQRVIPLELLSPEVRGLR